MKLNKQEKTLVEAAITARARAYAPYSRFKVGAALLLADGRVVTGVNVENASFGLTVCAERNAIAAAVLAGAKPGDVVAGAVAAAADGPTSPCGACRQVLAELAAPQASLVLWNVANESGERHRVMGLLPHAFLGDGLPRKK